MRAILNLFAALPWWAAVAILLGIAALIAWSMRRRGPGFGIFPDPEAIQQAFLETGNTLKGATATVHEVQVAPVPVGPSPYDPKEGDEDFCEGLDGEEWDPAEGDFYLIEATITPADPNTRWDPTALALVTADFNPKDPMEVSEHMGALHSAERFVNGKFVKLKEGDLKGEQRLRMLFGVPKGLREVKFCMMFARFGHIRLPKPTTGAPAPKAASSVSKLLK
jgi:hypothetical protein